jgi:peptidase M48-like protein
MTLALCLVSCITITNTSTGDFDFKDRFDKASKEIVERSIHAEEAVLKGQRASVDPTDEQFIQRHFVKADELVLAHMSEVKEALGNSVIASFFNEYITRRSTLLNFTLELKPSLDIVEAKGANATAFPSGKILLNRPLAEAFDANDDGFDSALLGILIHELIHVRDGHALEQWATSDSRRAWAKDKVIGSVSSVTALIPFLSIKYDMQYPLTFGSAKQLPALSEYAADMGAVSLLDRAGFDSGRYVAFLFEMSANITGTASKTGPSLLRQRVECLRNFSTNRFEEELQRIVIGSTDAGDSVVQTLDLRVYYRFASLLDSPEAVAKEVPGKPGMSDADRRSILLMTVRKAMYTGCAIRHSFPEVAVKQGVLMTPTFDLNIFAQYF